MILGEEVVNEKGMYFATSALYKLIRDAGGTWSDGKERPIVCLMKSTERKDLYWDIPVGNYDHRDDKAKKRIQRFLEQEDSEIDSCYYHIGKTLSIRHIFLSVNAYVRTPQISSYRLNILYTVFTLM